MVCLTGDVHQRSYRGTDTRFSSLSEVQLAIQYGHIAEKYGLRITLFLTGKAALEEPEGVRRLAAMAHCEIGGHTYAAFRDPWSRIYRKLYKTPWGTIRHQSQDIGRTLDSLQQVTGKRISVWRNHSYTNTTETPTLLEQAGICRLSDEVNPAKLCGESLIPGLVSVPINVLPDHEHLLHGKYVHGQAKPAQLSGRVSIGEWLTCVQSQVQTVREAGGVATLLAHPLCMEVADGMRSFESLCRFLQPFSSCWVSNASLDVVR
ncbi:MAG: polysaccharide deacetylase family protein [Nitrospira sp.]|nr:polysaccharide deacetylase family protein [Nitrospira sp.]MDR4486368.1 polysaccharide deacetylase family protein [Nitrospirales bacterium]